MIENQCPKCKLIGVGVTDKWGHIIQCNCIPSGKTCKDCKFESMCLLEQVIDGTEKDGLCKIPFERGFAEPGQFSYRELVQMEWDKEAKAAEEKQKREQAELEAKQKRALLAQNTHVYTEQMIIEFILPYNLRKIYKTLPPGMTEEEAIERTKPKYPLDVFLKEADSPEQGARMYLDMLCPSWKRDIGQPVPERTKKILEYYEMQVKVNESA
ncbi:hypothetical protein [Aneurinibacillus thermoaerophilus]|uniref:Uncharacterized protein n=1 Tax=Aneurinibacillus thermoaerophilus TaxID=143495 RepID=A0ABX8YFZ7_ANETH|nr:hypothetical protein [Aneurinibacillus thermoaerophilus]QYY44731.1 hypothetical protein K3F53_18990 [Aneurinibacillus thermoaerophilus]